jgi:hypothetical protein
MSFREKSSSFLLRSQVGEQPKIARTYFGRVWSLSNHRNVILGQESLNQLQGMSWCVVTMQLPRSHVAKSSVKMKCTELVLIPTSSASSQPVTWRSCMIKVHTWSVSLSFRLVEGLLEWASLSTDVQPSLNQLYHSLICVMPIALSPKIHWIFWMVSTWLLPSFWQNLTQYCYSSRSIIFAENNKCNIHCVHTLTHMLAAHDWCCLLAGRYPHKRMKVPSTFIPQHTSCTSLVSVGKKKSRRILFEQPMYMISSWPVVSKSTLMIPNNFLCIWS